jgi:hypothetical protein
MITAPSVILFPVPVPVPIPMIGTGYLRKVTTPYLPRPRSPRLPWEREQPIPSDRRRRATPAARPQTGARRADQGRRKW